MEIKKLKILIVDDDQDDAFLTTRYVKKGLSQFALTIDHVMTFSEAISRLEANHYDMSLFDYRLDEFDGLELMRRVRALGITIPIILLTGQGDEEVAVSAMKEGVSDYLPKRNLSSEHLCHAICYALELHKTETLRKKVALSFNESEAKYLTIVKTTTEGFWMFDADLNTIDLNQALMNLLGHTKEEILQKKLIAFVRKDKLDLFKEQIKIALAGENHVFDTVLQAKNGHDIYVLMNATTIQGKKGKAVQTFAFLTDITQLKEAEKERDYNAHLDPLTGLPNRVLWFDRLDQAIAEAKRYPGMIAVLFLNLDRFKSVNDVLGHDIGDLLLKEAAKRLSALVRRMDTTARMGGDEFLIILQNITNEEDVSHLARKVVASLSQPFFLKGHECRIEVSIGISLYPIDGIDRESLLKNADIAMCDIKKRGGNRFQFHSADMNTKIYDRRMMENRLRRALERKEFVLYYQPQVDIHTWKITGMEALIRWHSPDLGLLSSDQLVPLAEEIGLIIPIGEWVLKTACRQSKLWQEAGIPTLQMGVNLSGHQLKQKNLIKMLSGMIQETGIPKESLALELTESVAMHNVEEGVDTLSRLHEMGIDILIDDFGVGYSSLNYLKRLPIQTLKIDKSFVDDVASCPDDLAIITAIVAMAHTLNLKVIAEGVETVEQLKVLKSLRCNEMQGYLFSKPLPSEEATRLLLRGNKHLDFSCDFEKVMSSRIKT